MSFRSAGGTRRLRTVVWARPLLPDETALALALWHLGIAALLAAGLVRVSRLGRPLLTALWAVTLARLGSLAAGYASIALRQQNLDLGSEDCQHECAGVRGASPRSG